MSVKKQILTKILPAFLEAWQLRVQLKGSLAKNKSYKEGYWDGVSDTLKIGLQPPSVGDTTLH